MTATATTEGNVMPILLAPAPAPVHTAPEPKPESGTVVDAIDHLATLTGPNEVKELLVERDVKGVRGNGWRCAIAVYLNRYRRAPSYQIGVTTRAVCVGTREAFFAVRDTPPAVAQFIGLFDDGMYPELEEK